MLVGLDAELGFAHSTSAEAIRAGMLIAIEEVNLAGGVLGGRRFELVERANHSVPARSIDNIRELAALPDLVGVFCGRFSPAVLESLPVVHEVGLPLLDPWGAADGIVDNGYQPNYVFRLSLRDSWAIGAMLGEARGRGYKRVGLLLLNTSWGRSSLRAAEAWTERTGNPRIAATRWFNWNDTSLQRPYDELRQAGAEAIILVANAAEAALLIKEVAALPTQDHRPILSHWGVSGGELAELAGPALQRLDFTVIQTFSFIEARGPRAANVIAAHDRILGSRGPRSIKAAVGVAHAYDLMHLLAMAVQLAGTTDRKAVRDALERLGPYDGLVRRYQAPFTPNRHEALAADLVFMGRYDTDGAIVRVKRRAAGDAR